MLGLDVDYDVTPRMLAKIVYAGAQESSFARGSEALGQLAEVEVSSERVRRMSTLVGAERVAQRDAAAEQFAVLPLPEQSRCPTAVVPRVACVQMDGGRVQIRPRDVPRESSSDSYWREVKVGDLRTFHSEVRAEDPCPQLPGVFLDPRRMAEISREIKGFSAAEHSAEPASGHAVEEPAPPRERPEPLVLSVVASHGNVHEFGKLLAAAAYERGLHAAPRKAFVADGAEANWTVWRTHFSHYTPILDFVHAVSYVYAAAHAGCSAADGWQRYARWAQWLWGGQCELLLAELERRLAELAGDEAPSHVARDQLQQTLGYLQHQRQRVRYDEYRRQGLPTTSSYVESTVKCVHRRVKGTEKFWSLGLEALLQLVADHLSETRPLSRYWQSRRPAPHRRYHAAA